jgi:hypothetical protein
MCRFYATQMLPMLCREGFRFVWRLDDDGIINSPVKVDIFNLMEIFGYVYGFKKIHSGQHEDVVESLGTFALNYVLEHQVPMECEVADLTRVVHFANNLFLTDTSFWVRVDVAAFLKAVDDSDGIFEHGWGDSLIMALALKIFAPPEKVAQFLSLDYSHRSHNQVLSSGVGDWTLRFYGERHSRWYSWGANSAFLSNLHFEQEGRNKNSAGPLDQTRLLSSYFCRLSMVTLNLAGTFNTSNPLCVVSLPIATVPSWVCNPFTTPAVAGTRPQSNSFNIRSTCVSQNEANSSATRKHPTFYDKKLAFIAKCNIDSRGSWAHWASCVRRVVTE